MSAMNCVPSPQWGSHIHKHTPTHSFHSSGFSGCPLFATSSVNRITLQTVNMFFEASVQSSSRRVKVSVYLMFDVTSADEQFGRVNMVNLCFSKYCVSKSDSKKVGTLCEMWIKIECNDLHIIFNLYSIEYSIKARCSIF